MFFCTFLGSLIVLSSCRLGSQCKGVIFDQIFDQAIDQIVVQVFEQIFVQNFFYFLEATDPNSRDY